MSLSHKAMLICVLSGLAVHAGPVFADTPPIDAKTDAQTQEQTEEKRKTLMADATAALAETQGALVFLDACQFFKGGRDCSQRRSFNVLQPV